MQPKFTTTSTFTYDEFKKFNFQLMGKRCLILSALTFLILALCTVILMSISMLIYTIVVPLFLYLLYKLQVKRFYKAHKSAHDTQSEFEFYDSYFILKEKSRNSEIGYEKLNKIIFTKENAYLMLSKDKGFMLTKKNFPEGLEEFLKSIAPKKKK